MKKSLLTLVIFCIYGISISQNPRALEKIKAAHIGFITQRLDLSPEEAKGFWPIFDEYSEKRQALKKEYLETRRQFKQNQLTEEESNQLVTLGLQMKTKELELDKEYSVKLKAVIGSQKLIILYKAESDFRELLLKQLQKRKEKRKN